MKTTEQKIEELAEEAAEKVKGLLLTLKHS